MADNRLENSQGSFGAEGSYKQPHQVTFDVYVARIPPNWTEENLLKIFSPFGEIMSVDLRSGAEIYGGSQFAPMKQTAVDDFCFVRFSVEESAKNAVDSLMGYRVENGTLQVNMGRRSKNRQDQGRQGNLDFTQSKKTYSELKRTNQSEYRRSSRQSSRSDNEYGGGYNSASSSSPLKTWNSSVERPKHREEVVLVTEVDSPIRFWGQLAKSSVARHLSTASEELQLYCPTGLKVAENSHKKNKIYGGVYSTDNLWYRCSIIKFLPQGMVVVRYVDFGNTETVKKDSLVELPPSLADARPFAQLYHLADCAISTDPEANDMTYALGIEQLKNLVIGKLVNAKSLSETSQGGFNVLVSFPNDSSGKNVNDLMLEGGCVQRIKTHSEGGRIEKSVAEKPLNEESRDSSSAGSPKNEKNTLRLEVDKLKLTVKFQAETICNLNKLFESVKRQNDELCLELDEANKMKKIITAVTDLHQARCAASSVGNRTSNIDLAISVVADTDNCITLDKAENYKKLCLALDSLKSAQDSLRNCEEKENIKELVEHRNRAREELCEIIEKFIREVSLLNVTKRAQKLEEVLRKLSIFHHRYDGEDLSLKELIENYEKWKGNGLENDVKSIRHTTDSISKKLAGEFMKLGKLVDPEDGLNMEDCGTIDINSVAKEFIAAVAAEVQRRGQESENSEEIQTTAPLIKCLKKELQNEINDVSQLRSQAQECARIQDGLRACLNQYPDVTALIEIRRTLKSVKSKYRHKLADKKDLEENDEMADESEISTVEKDLVDLRTELHHILVKETLALESLAKIAVENFPELLVQYPELGLEKFMSSNGLIKQGWELSYYLYGDSDKVVTSSQGEVALATEFNGEKCLLKEFSLDEISDIDGFEAQAVAYSRVKHPNLRRVQALFYDKTHRKAFIQLPYYEKNLKKWLESEPSEKAKRDVICDIVRALAALHEAKITHGSVLVENIFLDHNDKCILGEYCFSRDTLQRVSSTAEILLQNSAPVSCDASPVFDMYCLGEIAWMVFLEEKPVPRDITSLQKYSQNNAVSSLLSFLLALNGGVRPTAERVTHHPFFTDDNYFDQEKAKQNALQNTGETSPPEEKTLPEENTIQKENFVHSTLTQPKEKALSDKSILPVDTLLEEQISITLDESHSIPEKSTLLPDLSIAPEEKFPSEEVVPEESPAMEEALPDEYVVNQRKVVVDGNEVEKAEEINASSFEQENCKQEVNTFEGSIHQGQGLFIFMIFELFKEEL